ncbi:MAG: ATP-binding protein [Coxiellaceae bacterium]|nr:ATP-binding protein [Coxiellaceae bacterium]
MKEEIISRQQEQQELSDMLGSNKAEFLAVYGRRRVGKSYLLNHYFKSRKCVYFRVLGLYKGALGEQLENFSEAISETFYDGLPIQAATRWKEAFQQLTTAIEKRAVKDKVVLFFDELPWMDTPRSGLLAAIDYFWNKYWCHLNNVKFIICGSSASWIIKKIINNKGGLHNRVTRQLNIRPFNLSEVKRYMKYLGCQFNHQQIVELYMAFGGIPFYLSAIKKNLSAAQNINHLYFRQGSVLFDEFNKLFHSLFNDADAYIELIKVIAAKHYGISRKGIEKQCMLTSGGSLSTKLNNLEEAGFILSFTPMGHKSRGRYYKVIDEFSLFYLTWVQPEKQSLIRMEADNKFWIAKCGTPAWYTWAGYAFESVCYKHISQIRKALDIPDGSRSHTWRHTALKGDNQSGAQIDLLFDRPDGCITVCEIKYTEKPFCIDKAYANVLQNKIDCFVNVTKIDKQVFIAMISARGIKSTMYSEELISAVIDLGDFF